MAERYTFEELKHLELTTEFWSNSEKFRVTTKPIHTQNTFYGDSHEKLEWDGYCEKTMRERHFVVADNKTPCGAIEYLIFKAETKLGDGNVIS